MPLWILFLTLCQDLLPEPPTKTLPLFLLLDFSPPYRPFPSTPCLSGNPTCVVFGKQTRLFSAAFPFSINLVDCTWTLLANLKNIDIFFFVPPAALVAQSFSTVRLCFGTPFVYCYRGLPNLPTSARLGSRLPRQRRLFVSSDLPARPRSLSSLGHSSVELPFSVSSTKAKEKQVIQLNKSWHLAHPQNSFPLARDVSLVRTYFSRLEMLIFKYKKNINRISFLSGFYKS